MNPEVEMLRLRELMPASGRMLTKMIKKPSQSRVIHTPFPPPWKMGTRPIYINFELWQKLDVPQRDLLLLHAVSWLLTIRWFKLDLYRGIIVAGTGGAIAELAQGDAIGFLLAGGLSAIAVQQIWRKTRSSETEIEADDMAVNIASRRGYSHSEAAQALLMGIEAAARLEGRSSLNFTELVRSQHLRSFSSYQSSVNSI
ncbi:MAG: DUF3318 domain-containing protein [Spirulinaceae cyanobacterium]